MTLKVDGGRKSIVCDGCRHVVAGTKRMLVGRRELHACSEACELHIAATEFLEAVANREACLSRRGLIEALLSAAPSARELFECDLDDRGPVAALARYVRRRADEAIDAQVDEDACS